MKRRLAAALIATILAAALAVKAQADGAAVPVGSGKAAIDRFAGRLTYEIASSRSTGAMSWQVLACRKRGDGLVCTGEWTLAGERCSVTMEALRVGRSIRVTELGRLACSREAAESGVAPAP
jgi:hypothetical protein